MIHGETATVVETGRPAAGHVRMRLYAPQTASAGLPGQFVNVRCAPLEYATVGHGGWDAFSEHRRTDATRALLMRPFAIHRTWRSGPDAGHIEILFKIVGRGTARLAETKVGESIEILGPLGHGFDLDWCATLTTAAVVAGGVGVAPLYPLVQHLREHDVRTVVIVGAMTEADLPLESADSRVTLSFMATRPEVTLTAREFEGMGCSVGIVTMEGEKGYIGLPTDMLDRFLHHTDGGARGEAGVFTCGPWGMMREVARHAREHALRCQVLLEERMGCGVGACMACSCRVRSADGAVVPKRVCIDGPVFDASEVIWDDA